MPKRRAAAAAHQGVCLPTERSAPEECWGLMTVVQVREGETVSVTLEGHASRGYAWSFRRTDVAAGLVLVDRHAPGPPRPVIPGRDSDEVFTFRATSAWWNAGAAVLHFELRDQRWGNNYLPPADVRHIPIKVLPGVDGPRGPGD